MTESDWTPAPAVDGFDGPAVENGKFVIGTRREDSPYFECQLFERQGDGSLLAVGSSCRVFAGDEGPKMWQVIKMVEAMNR
jgi:hypothetical protein